MQTDARRIGILAGGGSLPREIAACVTSRGHSVAIVGIDGEADADFSGYPFTRANWAQIGRILRAFRDAGTQDLVIAGRVKRPDLLSLKPDFGFFRAIAEITGILATGGDDDVLRAVVRFFETKGLRVIGVAEAAPELVIGPGALGGAAVTEGIGGDIRIGFDVVRALGAHDIGQAVVVTEGRVEAIEAAEGTDGMLTRLARQRGPTAATRRGVLVKRPKPGQELRVDLPAIGPGTVRLAAAAGLAGIAVEEGQVVTVERRALVEESRQSGIFVAGMADDMASPAKSARRAAPSFAVPGKRTARPRALADAARGSEALASLAPLSASAGAVVAGRHVLAIETGEGLGAMLERAAGLRQWGGHRWMRRRGVVVLAHASDLERAIVDLAVAAGLEGIAVVQGDAVTDRFGAAARAADEAGLFVAIVSGVTASPGLEAS